MEPPIARCRVGNRGEVHRLQPWLTKQCKCRGGRYLRRKNMEKSGNTPRKQEKEMRREESYRNK